MSKEEENRESLHGETAAKRQAITELLFFASVGDLYRCRKITTAWGLQLTDPKTADYDKRTPLHLAAAEGAYSVVAWLLSKGVDVNPIDRFSRTPLEDAVRGDHGEVATVLIQNGGKVIGKDNELVELADSPLAGNVRLFTGYDPEWEIDPAHLILQEKIGEGEFGVVHKAKWHGTVVAVKILKDTGAVAIGDFKTELNVLLKVHHTHTVQFLGAVTKHQPFMIVTEFMTGGSLLDFFKSNSTFSQWRALQLALDCARGLAYLHNRSPQAVIHRDLKPANLMLGGPKIFNSYHKKLLQEEMGVLKIADFGLSKSLKLGRPQNKGDPSSKSALDGSGSGHTGGAAVGGKGAAEGSVGGPHASAKSVSAPAYKLTGETGSYRFMAPEVFRHEQYNNKVDVYGFAMIAYQLFEGVPPFYNYDPVEAARAASLEHKRPQWGVNKKNIVVPPKIRALVEQCWTADHEQRPEFEEVVEVLESIARDLQPTVSDGVQESGCCSLQ